jgi:smad nuclear-interacting protein 1
VRVKREPPDREERQRNNDRRRENRRNRPENPFTAERSNAERYGKQDAAAGGSQPPQPKEEPDFALSGKLTEDTNTYRGVVIKYNQPAEARKPRKRWRLYPFKGDQALPMLPVHRSSAYLLGRERRIADIPVDHPSCSKQHAVLQYRLVDYEREDGTMGRQVRPYIIDLGSTNGTYVNNQRIDAQRYVQLMEKDVLKFGYSTREYVLLHEKSDFAEIDDYD